MELVGQLGRDVEVEPLVERSSQAADEYQERADWVGGGAVDQPLTAEAGLGGWLGAATAPDGLVVDGDGQLAVSVAPREGMALLFHHPLSHRGATVTAGQKVVLRSDVMYARDRAN